MSKEKRSVVGVLILLLAWVFILIGVVACILAWQDADLAMFNRYVVYVLSVHLIAIWVIYVISPLIR